MGPHGRSDSEKTADEGGAASWRREEAPRDGKRAILGDGAAQGSQKNVGRAHVQMPEHLGSNPLDELGMRERDGPPNADGLWIVRVGDGGEGDSGSVHGVVDDLAGEGITRHCGAEDHLGRHRIERVRRVAKCWPDGFRLRQVA